MTYRDPAKSIDLFSAMNAQRASRDTSRGILKLNEVIEWSYFRPLLEEVCGYTNREAKKGGRPPFDPLLMLKVLVLQKYYGLSDEATEFEISDRDSFKHFLGLELGDDIPDARTIWDFKQRIEQGDRNGSQRLFKAFNQKLTKQGLIAREGSIVDASFIDAPRQRNTRDENKQIKEGKRPKGFEKDTAKGRQKDCDARWAKKNNETHFGYKNHVNVDAKTKLIIEQETSPANLHDSQVFKKIVNEKDERVMGDSAYWSEEHEDYLLKQCDAEEFLMRKATRNNTLSQQEEKRNQQISRIRVRVEHVFGRMKQMGADLCRSIGIKRATQHNNLCNLVYNMDRCTLLAR